ncbi:MucR family transcriptional regulator [Telmatospirillum sp.]|uniref:MucR family transcriptional regulator n=1 Tax=Telmatospirillum sp. TaxID=2079197 RepID=UPI00283DE6C3|nr:MucR family transcriptional regulator [Telmatospirillum sp.]MDR3435625.1 MucR family transcriptional regulator [Telmatospirillum sp.]
MKTATARLVCAYLQRNPVAPSDLPGLITTIHSALSAAGEVGNEPTVMKPAVPIKKSVKAEAIVCLECGKEFSMMKRHLAADHGMTPAEYREKWSLDANYPMTASDYAARRSELAKKIGLGRKKKPVAAEQPAAEVAKPRRKKLSLNWA